MEKKGHVQILENMSKLILGEIAKANYSSLLNDFVESELFLIDGDSLLITCLNDKKLKTEQNLHFIYLVERYLLDLKSKGGQFIVVFFKDFEHSYFQIPPLLPLRTALILHLQQNTDINVQTEFSGCFSEEWNCFLEQNCPYFLLISDEGITQLQTFLFYFFIIQSWYKRISIALTSGQESDIIRVYAYFMLSRYKNQHFFKENEQKMKRAYQTIIEHLKKSSVIALTPLFHQFKFSSLEKEIYWSIDQLRGLWPKGSDIRRILCVLSCSLSLKMYHHFLEKRKEKSSEIDIPENNLASLTEVQDLCRMYCLSVVFLLHLPLSQRACARLITSSWKDSISTFLQMKKWCEFFVLRNLESSKTWNVDFTYVCDINDGPLWINIAYYYENEHIQGLQFDLGKAIEVDYNDLWSAVSHLVREFPVGPSVPLRVTKQLFLQKKQSPIGDSQEMVPNLGFIPVTSPIIRRFVGDMLDQVTFLRSDDPVVTSLVKYKEFHELVHWHSHKPLSDHYERTKSFTQGGRGPSDLQGKSKEFLRSKQKLQAFQQRFGSNLDGTTSKVIVTQSVVPKKTFVAGKNKKSQCSKADIIIQENTNRLLEKEKEKESHRWETLSFSIEGEMKENFHSGITKLEDFLKTCKSNSVKFTVEMVGMKASLNAWKEHCQCAGKVRKDFSIAIHMMKRIHSIMERYQEFLQNPDKKEISRCLRYLGFDNLVKTLDPTQIMENERKSKKFRYAIDMGPARFQLQQMGHYLIRNERKDPDPRVNDFIPDTWQRELLDVVDNNESAVIVAPTSSGKTYASYYCMEKVLRESDNGVIVYVSPTKALVNQVSATVQSRYTKRLPEGQVLCGVFTRDFRSDILNCQVLVTVPACFEILLLSPTHQEWVEKIRYVIFDEVHCLGGEIGADIWEHLLVMIRCPFLALSATISNPEHLTEWLQSVRRYWQGAEKNIDDFQSQDAKDCIRASKRYVKVKKSYRVRLVLYEERYNDLEKHVCSLRGGDIVFNHYHPLASLTTDHIEKYGFPSDLSLSPRESIQLYDTMVQVWKGWPKAQELCPEEFIYFKNKIVITKMDARKYEAALKEEICNWMKNGNENMVKKVLKILRPASVSHSDSMGETFPLLVEKLRKMNKLPALFFMFKIIDVEKRAQSVCDALEKKQVMRQPDNVDKEVHMLTNKLKKVKKSMEKTSSVPENALKRSSRMDHSIIREAEHTALQKKLEKKTEIPPDCTYANIKVIDAETLEMMLYSIKKTRKGKELENLAKRGIGYHHGSLDAKERRFIEILFRKGFVRVVTATGTLALGINMPCRSVVFAQNSIYLDALNYRQMSGRAGRRGQDFLGNVFFYDIPLPKIEKLIKSKVPELKGQFPLSMTLILRLMLLASRACNVTDAEAKVISVLNHSLLSFKKPRIKEILKLYFLFSLQFLVKEGYLDCEGNPIGFAGLVAHLYYEEPSNLLFVSFLKKGLFHNLCQPTKKGSKHFSQDVMEKLTLVLANLFGRRYVPAKFLDANFKFYQSKVFLEELPTDFNIALRKYNEQVTRDFSYFLLIVSKFADMKVEHQLPLSKIEFPGKNEDTSKLASHLMSCKEDRSAVSPFACLSGVTNQDLLQVGNIDSITLRTIGITYAQAPLLYPEKFDFLGRRIPLNAYALDFYKHRSLKGIEQDNRISEGDAYILLKNFSLILKSISVSLRELCEDENDNVVLAFEQLSNSFNEKFKKV
ncbi:probable ATP-dependent RNA helicase DDX60 isoform X2 [Monodelphis domestica]|uniref:probable ATP-dependent RNA helicase DDX60 isoform X2 n=1 Tax=Monodelphis domestica TaxID=13616 RepID=UPI0024E25A0D|nr:probable ATP-dependent RNA helicase DDX60 isoform X2 [Monodelphis domestica]